MSRDYAERRLLSWALSDTLHEPCWPEETIEYRIMRGDTAKSGKGVHGDGGMSHAATKYGVAITEKQKAVETARALMHLRERDRESYRVVHMAFTDRPGYVMPVRIGAEKLAIGKAKWSRLYERGLIFVDATLFSWQQIGA